MRGRARRWVSAGEGRENREVGCQECIHSGFSWCVRGSKRKGREEKGWVGFRGDINVSSNGNPSGIRKKEADSITSMTSRVSVVSRVSMKERWRSACFYVHVFLRFPYFL